MDIRKSAVRGVAVLAVAFAAGHLLQTMNKENAATAEVEVKPTGIEPVAAGPDEGGSTATDMAQAPADAAPADPAMQTAALTDEVSQPAPEPEAPGLKPAPQPPAPAATPDVAGDCPVSLDLMSEGKGVIALTLIAPCHAGERVVLRHAGLAFTGKTSASGSLFLSLPALETAAKVSVLFGDSSSHEASLAMTDLGTIRRFGVQWMADDTFQLHAFEKGAAYGQPGDVSAAGQPGGLGDLMILGDATVENPMLAEVYTYPADATVPVEVVVEAAVTDQTCGRELMGETLTSVAGTSYVTDLTVATPGCDAIGDILVLKNLVPDLKLAAN